MGKPLNIKQMWIKRWVEGDVGVNRFEPTPMMPFGDGTYWYLTKEMTWKPKVGNASHLPGTVEVNKGFVTDFASIPQLFWMVIPPHGTYGYPAVAHDWLYWTQEHSRANADELFMLGMTEMKVPWYLRFPMFWSVRLFGWWYWAQNKSEKTAGRGRVVVKFPTDTKVTWEEWRQEPGAVIVQ